MYDIVMFTCCTVPSYMRQLPGNLSAKLVALNSSYFGATESLNHIVLFNINVTTNSNRSFMKLHFHLPTCHRSPEDSALPPPHMPTDHQRALHFHLPTCPQITRGLCTSTSPHAHRSPEGSALPPPHMPTDHQRALHFHLPTCPQITRGLCTSTSPQITRGLCTSTSPHAHRSPEGSAFPPPHMPIPLSDNNLPRLPVYPLRHQHLTVLLEVLISMIPIVIVTPLDINSYDGDYY